MTSEDEARRILELAQRESSIEWSDERALRVIEGVHQRMVRGDLNLYSRPRAPSSSSMVIAVVAVVVLACSVWALGRSSESGVADNSVPIGANLGPSEGAEFEVRAAMARLQDVRTALDGKRYRDAIAMLHASPSSYRNLFAEEFLILEAEAECGRGNHRVSRQLTEQFRREYGATALDARGVEPCGS
jgi:hypothetical protein